MCGVKHADIMLLNCQAKCEQKGRYNGKGHTICVHGQFVGTTVVIQYNIGPQCVLGQAFWGKYKFLMGI